MKVMKTVALIGMGLMGTSLALALQDFNHQRHQKKYRLIGWDESMAIRRAAKKVGAYDWVGANTQEVIAQADVIVLAIPVRHYAEVWPVLTKHCPPRALITDVGSVKGEVIRTAHKMAPTLIPRFIPAHPIAGREYSGPQAALADLFVGQEVILTPLPTNKRADINAIKLMWRHAKARVSLRSPEAHDDICALISHVPHLISMALVHEVMRQQSDTKPAKKNQASSDAHTPNYWQYAAGGFRDFSRIAGSDATMWHDIFSSNRQAILQHLDGFERSLQTFRALLKKHDKHKDTRGNRPLWATINAVSQAQKAWKKKKYG